KYSCYAATRPPSFALSLHDALPILSRVAALLSDPQRSFEHTLRAMMATNHLGSDAAPQAHPVVAAVARELLNKSDNERSGVLSRSEEHTSELQSRENLVCRLLLEKK